MSRFLDPLLLEDDGDGLPWRLFQSLRYQSDYLAATVLVPEGFSTDLASIPRALQWLYPPTGSYSRAAVIHDWLYATAEVADQPVDRGDADTVLNEAMTVCGVGRFVRWTIYTAVRVGGWQSWARYRAS